MRWAPSCLLLVVLIDDMDGGSQEHGSGSSYVPGNSDLHVSRNYRPLLQCRLIRQFTSLRDEETCVTTLPMCHAPHQKEYRNYALISGEILQVPQEKHVHLLILPLALTHKPKSRVIVACI
ncbi:hypothetical protein IW261DRAFT_1528432 [Armillaria novae-zelandiae]|uniref:Secreted protein n=1 Tax=Armillaria novae-zelandiae TaxID=153914 RepID=A0AA39NAR8_9AGAR|nr:hypothetical protein IW261DRAFT_1528432 [Armillaria novae-zelandiae]